MNSETSSFRHEQHNKYIQKEKFPLSLNPLRLPAMTTMSICSLSEQKNTWVKVKESNFFQIDLRVCHYFSFQGWNFIILGASPLSKIRKHPNL